MHLSAAHPTAPLARRLPAVCTARSQPLSPERQAEAQQADELTGWPQASQIQQAAGHRWRARAGGQQLLSPAAPGEQAWGSWLEALLILDNGRISTMRCCYLWKPRDPRVHCIGGHDARQQDRNAGEHVRPPAAPAGAVPQRPQQGGGQGCRCRPALGARAGLVQQRRAKRQLRRHGEAGKV